MRLGQKSCPYKPLRYFGNLSAQLASAAGTDRTDRPLAPSVKFGKPVAPIPDHSVDSVLVGQAAVLAAEENALPMDLYPRPRQCGAKSRDLKLFKETARSHLVRKLVASAYGCQQDPERMQRSIHASGREKGRIKSEEPW